MRATLFITCLTDLFFPETGEDVVRLLRRLGVDVTFPKDQTCCGQPAYNSGFHQDARALARHLVAVFEDSELIVSPSGSCVSMLREAYPRLFADEPAWQASVNALAARTYELSEFIVDVLGVEDVGARFAGRIAYHDACHGLRFLGLGRQARALLSHVAGAEVLALPGADQCCGFGGLFAIKQRAISEAMLGRKLTAVGSTEADLIVTGDVSCMTQIAGGLSRAGSRTRARHIAEVLANMVDSR